MKMKAAGLSETSILLIGYMVAQVKKTVTFSYLHENLKSRKLNLYSIFP